MGAALTERGLPSVKGLGQRGYSDFLVIPIHPNLHFAGPEAIDGHIGRKTWEGKYGTQADHLDEVGRQLGLDLWLLHAESKGLAHLYQKATYKKPSSDT